MKNGQPAADLVMPVSEFKAKCLDILARLGNHSLAHVTVTRHGRPVAELYPPRATEADVRALFTEMAGTVSLAPDIDLTEPVIDMSDWNDDPLGRQS